jgi:hypothetical protein
MAEAETRGNPARPHRNRSPVGASPGTLIADPSARQSALNLTLISPDDCKFVDDASLDDVAAACRKWPLIWLDCVGLANISLIEEIGKIFGLHPLALEDAVNTGQRAKADFFDDHAFFVLSMIDDAKTARYEQISFFFGDNFVVTFQEREGDPFEPLRRRIRESNPSRLRHRKADYLAYAPDRRGGGQLFPRRRCDRRHRRPYRGRTAGFAEEIPDRTASWTKARHQSFEAHAMAAARCADGACPLGMRPSYPPKPKSISMTRSTMQSG